MNLTRRSILVVALFATPVIFAAPRGDLWCASLLADPGPTTKDDLDRLRRAILVPMRRFTELRHDVRDLGSWRADLRDAWREWRVRPSPRVRIGEGSNRKVSRHLARMMSVGHDRLKDAHNETLSGSFKTFPVRRLAKGREEIRAYLAEVRERAERLQSEFEALPPPAVLPRDPVRGGRILGSAVGTFVWSGVACGVLGLTVGALQMHWWHTAAAVGLVGLPAVGYKVVPRYVRMYLHAAETYGGVVGRAGPVGPREFAIEHLRVIDDIERVLADRHASRDTLVYSASTVEIPFSTGDDEERGTERTSPTSAEIVAAVHRRGWIPAPVDARRFESDLAFFFDLGGVPTLFSLLREPGYWQDRR